MKKGIIAASAIGVGLFLIAGLVGQSAVADRGWGGPRGGHGPDSPMAGLGGPGAQFMFEALDLTPEQRDMVDGILERYGPQLKALRASGRESRRLLMETTPDALDYMEVVEEASRVVGQNASQLVILTAELRRELHGVLTQEQRDKASEMRSDMRERFRERMQRRRARGEPADQA